MSARVAAASVLLLLTVGCASAPPAGEGPLLAPGRELVVAPGGSVSTPEGASVRFVGVRSDGRCPRGAECVWEGEAEIELAITDPSGRRGLEVATTRDPHSAVTVAGREILVVRLVPEPELERRIRPGEYRLTLALGAAGGVDGAAD